MDVVYYHLLVLIGVRVHLFPSRTQKLSLLSPTIVAGRLAAKIGNANTITGLPKGGPVFYACEQAGPAFAGLAVCLACGACNGHGVRWGDRIMTRKGTVQFISLRRAFSMREGQAAALGAYSAAGQN